MDPTQTTLTTDSKSAQESLSSRTFELSALITKMIHDLNNPLSALSMHAQLILLGARRDEEQPVKHFLDSLNRILSEVRRISTLTRRYGSIAHSQTVDLAPLELPALIQDILSNWGPRLSNVTLALQIEKNIPTLRANPQALRMMFDNMLDNALDAAEGEHLQLTLHVQPLEFGRTRIQFTDNAKNSHTGELFSLLESTQYQTLGFRRLLIRHLAELQHGRARFSPQTSGNIVSIEL